MYSHMRRLSAGERPPRLRDGASGAGKLLSRLIREREWTTTSTELRDTLDLGRGGVSNAFQQLLSPARVR
jgi:hypothetical protein